MRTVLYVLLALAMPAFAGQTVWKWVDEKGVTHFSDQPVPGATKMELNSSSRADPVPTNTPPPVSNTAPAQRGPAYSRFVIESPQQDEALINTGGKITIRLASTPSIAAGDMVTLYLDGARVEDFPPTAMSHELGNLPRGTHTLKAVVSTLQGEPIQETPPVTFHVRQESMSRPPVGPTLRNQKPRRTSGNKMPTTQPSYAAVNGAGIPAVIDPNTNMPAKKQPAPGGPKN